MKNIEKAYLSTYYLICLNKIKSDNTIKSFIEFLDSLVNSNEIDEVLKKYNIFLCNLKFVDFGEYVKNIILKTELNFELEEQISKELDIVNNLLKIDFEYLKKILNVKFKKYSEIIQKMPKFTSDFSELKIENIKKNIGNVFEINQAFVFTSDFRLEPIEIFEKISFKNLKGYDYQKNILYSNTKAFLKGSKVNNILLYGLLSEFSKIKIIQIFKDNLINLDKLYQKITKIPQKFIIFIDDISFCENDSSFSQMKALIEGSLVQCPKNAIIYATSNRRHIITETFRARMGDEIHLNDTINETTSLSERFGITLLYQKPTNEEFKKILFELADDCNIKINKDELIEKAQKSALLKGVRNPRIIQQFINNLKAGIEV